jgi:DNA-binding GntR family transcriptional regulator
MRTSPFNLRQQAYDRIRELLRSGDLAPGERVSSLGLSKRLGISRTPVREALSRLCSDGVVREVPGFGVLVHMPDEKELRELYGMREVLECYAAREAARNITDEELKRLAELLLQWRAMARHLQQSGESTLDQRMQDRWIKIDEKFHEIVLRAARSQLLFKTVDDMRLTARTLESRRGRANLSLGPAAKTLLDHTRLLRALQRRDAVAAEYWMRVQLAVGRDRHIAEVRRRDEIGGR